MSSSAKRKKRRTCIEYVVHPAPSWGILVADRASMHGMDWSDFAAWLSCDKDLAPATVKGLVRQSRTLERRGLDWSRFCRSPEEAHRAGRRMIHAYKAHGQFNAARLTARLFNHVAAYMALDAPEWGLTAWTLPKTPSGSMDAYEAAEIAILASYRCKSAFAQARRRAVVYLCTHASPRRQAIVAMRVADLRPQECAVSIPKPGKGGRSVKVALPVGAFTDGSPLQQWLDLIVGSEWLWVSENGSRITHGGWSRELKRISDDVGFRVNFNRFRHTHASVLDDHDVPVQRAMDRFGWRDYRTFDHYRHGNLERQRRTLARLGVPGYKNEDS